MRNRLHTTAQAHEPPNGAATPGCRPHHAMLLGASRCRPGGLLLALLTLGPAAAMAETYEGIDCPDAFYTEARGINDRGDIVGICDYANGPHGLVLRRGVFRLVDAPEALGPTAAFGINNRGDVVGYLLRRGRFTTIDPPDSGLTSARGIDDAGRIVGFYVGGENGGVHGFLRDGRGYRDIDFPGVDVTIAMGNSVTWIVGGYVDLNGISHGFVLKKGGYQSIDVPGAAHTRAFGVNVQGDVVGGWNASGCDDCFTNAFLLTRRGFEELQFPGALETVANGINASGQIVGTYVADDGSVHGFLRDRGDDN